MTDWLVAVGNAGGEGASGGVGRVGPGMGRPRAGTAQKPRGPTWPVMRRFQKKKSVVEVL